MPEPSLAPWMKRLLWFVGGYNLLAGVGMIGFYHEGFKLLSLAKPQLNLPIQLVGVLVGLFGVGYWLVAANPVENRNLLMLGFWSKALGSVLGLYYCAVGKLPPVFIVVLFFSDIIYLPPFLMILRRLYRAAREREEMKR
jgi:small multidrug resistance pump